MRNSRAACLLFIPLGLWLVGCSPPTGPVTALQMQALTNAVQKLTSDPITRIDRLDVGLLLVSTESIDQSKKQDFCMQRARRGWDLIPSITKP